MREGQWKRGAHVGKCSPLSILLPLFLAAAAQVTQMTEGMGWGQGWRGGGRGQEGDLHAVTSSEVAVDEVLVAEVLHSPRDVGHELYQHLGGKVLQDRQRRSR